MDIDDLEDWLMIVALAILVTGILVGVLTYFIARRNFCSNANVIMEQAKAKAKAIEYEAEKILQVQKCQLKESELELKQRYETRINIAVKEYNEKVEQLDRENEKKQQKIDRYLQDLEVKKNNIQEAQRKVLMKDMEQERIKEQYVKLKDELKNALFEYTGFTKEEAKKLLLKIFEEELCEYKASMIRKYERDAKEEAKKKANYVIAQATTRFSGEYASERLINVVSLPNDELKGRIIGKEGRNIKAIEMITGVDVIIDDTPSSITLSSFNLYRRAIATKTIEALVEDGRIQPARIEEVYEKTKAQMEEQIIQDGEDVIMDLGLGYMHPELVKLVGKMKYRASFGQNALGHSIEVANLASVIAAELGGDERLAKRAGLLHDIGKSLTQEMGGNHVDLGFDVCSRYQEHPVVLNAIRAHHGYEEPRSIEAAAVCTADTLSAGRPGARREALESFLKRSSELENLAMTKIGVKQAYAINSGRELRVIVCVDLVNDSQGIVLARELAQEIEVGFQYPGEIKVSVIRESVAVEFAKS